MRKKPQKIETKQRSKSLAGIGALAAAALTTAGTEAELIEVRVQTFTRLSDGSLQVTFQNGRSVIVPAGDWTIVDGRVFIEESAASQAGTSTSATAATSGGGGILGGDVNILGTEISPWILAGGAAVGGLGLALALDDDDSSSSSSSGSNGSTGLTASSVNTPGTITNSDDLTDDDTGETIISDLSVYFDGAQGTLTYTIEVTDPSGGLDTRFAYVDGAVLKVLDDPTVDDEGLYSVKITATDTSNGNTAEQTVLVTVDVISEITTNGTIADVEKDENDKADDVVVDDLSLFFTDADGNVTYDFIVETLGGQQVVGLLKLNAAGTGLLLNTDIGDTYVEGLSGGSEEITLAITVVATDDADGTEQQQQFALTLDATGVNDAPEIADGKSDTIIVDEINGDAGGGDILNDGSSILDVDLSTWVVDEDDTSLTWSITEQSAHPGLNINNQGELTGTIANGASDGSITIDVSDSESSVTLTVFIDIA